MPSHTHTLSLHDALPISECDPATEWRRFIFLQPAKMNFVAGKIDNLGSDLASPTVKENRAISALHPQNIAGMMRLRSAQSECARSEEHTSELQSLRHLVC